MDWREQSRSVLRDSGGKIVFISVIYAATDEYGYSYMKKVTKDQVDIWCLGLTVNYKL